MEKITKEEWRQVAGWPAYEVSSMGRVRSGHSGRWVEKSQSVDRDGYRLVSLWADGSGSMLRVSRLVCEAFHGAPFEGAQAAHKDGDPSNNEAENLRWATPAENSRDKHAHGTTLRGERHNMAKLCREDVLLIRASGESGRVLAERFGVSQATVSVIRSGRRWAHV